MTTWFRRAIWFLGFTAALTASAPLFLTTAALAVIFELVYNVTNARAYWDSVSEYGLTEHSDDIGNIDYLDSYHQYRTLPQPLSYNRNLERKSSGARTANRNSNYRKSINYLLGLPPTNILFQR